MATPAAEGRKRGASPFLRHKYDCMHWAIEAASNCGLEVPPGTLVLITADLCKRGYIDTI